MSNKNRLAKLKPTNDLLSSLAHEIIQPLTVIQAEIDLMALRGTPPSAVTLARLNKAVDDILAQVRQCQTYNPQETEPSPSLTLLAS